MAAEDFAPSQPEEDDLFDFAEVDVKKDDYEADVSTSSSDEEIMEAVQRAAADVQDELAPQANAEPEEIEDDELVANFPAGTLDGEDDDLFSFDELLSDGDGPEMDPSILDGEDRYGMTAQQVADHPDYSEADEELPEERETAGSMEPDALEVSAALTADAVDDEARAIEDDFDFDEPAAAEDLDEDPFGGHSIDREAEAEEFASLLQGHEEPPRAAAKSVDDEIQPAPRGPRVETEDSEETPIDGLSERTALAAGNRKPLYLLAGSFLALNLVLAVLAIFAFFRVGSGLQGMKTSLAGSLETIAREAQRAEEEIAFQKAEAAEEAAAEQSQATPDPNEVARAPMQLEPRERTEIRAARAEIAAGKFEVARKRLFQLLAVSDSPLSEEGRIAEEEANLLVAESFEAEARAYMEAQVRRAEDAAREQRP